MTAREEIIAANLLESFLTKRGHKLRSSGANRVTNACPLAQHKSSHRPVTIDIGKQVWHCNDCKIGGTVIDWVMHEKICSAADAMRILGGGRNGSEPVAVYDYTDASGKSLFQVCRFKPKIFRQRRPDGTRRLDWKYEERKARPLPAARSGQGADVTLAELSFQCQNRARAQNSRATCYHGHRQSVL
jgi:hypothetical protein